MLVRRWQAAVLPSKSQIKAMYDIEGLPSVEESFPPATDIGVHYHPFDEVRTVVSGELMFDVAGNKLLLRTGDKIIIPANTKHSFKTHGDEPCVCLVATKTW